MKLCAVFMRLVAGLLGVLFLCGGAASAATLPAGFSEQVLGTGWLEPVGIAFDPAPERANRIYVWERAGKVWVMENGVKASTPLLDISEEVGAWRDFGLLGMALHPNFAQNGYLYLFYVVDRHHLLNFGTSNYSSTANEYQATTIGRITRYTVRSSDGFRSVDPATRKVLVGETKSSGFPILHQSHGTGHLVFGADGTLLASCGDGASYDAMDDGGPDGNSYAAQALIDGIIQPKEDVGAFRSQLVDSLSGKIIRIDPETGDGIPSNPFYNASAPRSAKSRVWTVGLRNPYRFSLVPETGSHHPADADPGIIVLGDVGYGTWEDYQVVKGPGVNCGWPLFEGLTPNTVYQASPAENKDAPNPLGGFFKFRDLVIQETLSTPSWPNPSNTSVQIPATIPRFMHTRPVLDTGRGTNGPARTGIFSGNTAAVINIGAAGSPVTGPQFAGNTATGGAFYKGTEYPATYRNTYFFADYSQKWIKNLVFDANMKPTAVRDFATGGSPVFMATHPTQDSLVWVDRSNSTIRRIIYAPNGNRPPVAVATANVTSGTSPLDVTFSSAGSADPDGQALTYLWNFGDGTTSTAANPTKRYTVTGTRRFDPVLTVTDTAGGTSQASFPIFVNHTLPEVTLLSPIDGTKYTLDGDTGYRLTRKVVEAAGHPTFTQWEVFLQHNNHEHGEPPLIAPEALAIISPTYSPTETYNYRVKLTVTDDLGASVSREVRLFPNATNVAPQIAWSIGSQSRTTGAGVQVLDLAARASDADSVGIEFGELSVNLSGALSGDALSIVPGEGVTLSGSNVAVNSVVLGAFAGGTSSQPLSVVFNEAATPAAAQSILRRVGANFSLAGSRTLTATLDDGDGATTTSGALVVNVTASGNQTPSVSLTAPTNNATFTAPASITLNATASDSDGTVAKVEFYQGATKLGEDTSSPYTYAWTSVAAGTYALSARVTDNAGAVGVSSTVSVTVNGAPQSNGLPAPWQTQDIGDVGRAGTAAYANGTYTVQGSGSDIWWNADEYRYVYQPWTGDGVIVARVQSVVEINPWSVGGVMFRETLGADSKEIMMDLHSTMGHGFQWRDTTGGGCDWVDGPDFLPARWVKLQRAGNLFTGSMSADGVNWTVVGTRTLAMNSTCYVGLAVCSSSKSNLTTAVFTNVSTSGGAAQNQAPSVALTSPAAGATFTSPASVTLNATASDNDGTVSKVEFFNGATKLGEDTSSPYSLSWSGVAAGSYSLTAVATDNGGAVTTSAAVGITVNAPANQLPSVALTSPANGASFTAPATVSLTATASDADGTVAKVEFFSGGTKLGEDTSSPYAFSWTSVPAGTYSLTARVTDNSGAAVNSSAVSVTVNAPANQLPTVALTSPTAGATFTAPATVSLSATASDADGSVTKVEFFNGATKLGEDTSSPYAFSWASVAAGSYTLTAVATDNSGAMTTSSAVSISVNPPANQLPTVALTSPTAGATFTAPATVSLSATASDADGSVTKVEFFNGATKLGEDTSSPYAFSWASVAAGSYTLTAVATDNSGATTTSASVTINVNTPANQLPTVALTSPVAGAAFTAPATISLAATASDADGSVTKVEFYQGTTKVGEDTTSPYAFSWTGVAAGSYSLTARATDNTGAVATSAPVTVTVNTPANQLPTVALTSPTAGTGFTAPATISLTATASDADGTVTKVEFYQGAAKVGEDTTAPYAFSWTGVTAGSYSLTAQATDNTGAVATSTAVNITVNSPANQLPTVTLTSPAGGTTYTAPATVLLESVAGDADGSIAKVEFFNGATKLGEDTTSPYSLSWTGVTAGTYSLTARATDNTGATANSGAVSITVNAPANQFPTVALTAPANGATFTAPAAIALTAIAADADGTVARVEFYNGGTKLGEDTTAPYAFTWSGVAAGTYGLTARAIDNAGATTNSAAVSVTVSGSTSNVAPTVAITAPGAGRSFNVGVAVSITASAADTDGTVAKVEFFAGATKIGEDTSSPYAFTWTPATYGNYAITAKATDNAGAVTTSSSVTVNINALPIVTLTSPAGGTTYSPFSVVNLAATASDPDGSIAKVEFYRGSTLIGTDTSAPYTYAWWFPAVGTYQITARASDSRGALKSTSAITITVRW